MDFVYKINDQFSDIKSNNLVEIQLDTQWIRIQLFYLFSFLYRNRRYGCNVSRRWSIWKFECAATYSLYFSQPPYQIVCIGDSL